MVLRICSSVIITLKVYSCSSASLNSISSHNNYSKSTLIKQKTHQIKIINLKNYSPIINPISFTCFTSMADLNPSDVNLTQEGSCSVDPSCTEIIVVRHGETDWNAVGKMQGQLDVELNEIGRQQAIAVAERLSKEANICAIYSSDLKRALETAETIALKYGGLEVIRDEDLRERHLGDLQGRHYHELSRLAPKAYGAFKSSRTDEQIPGGGESRDQLYKRCTSALKRIGEKHRGQRVVVVSHGGAIRSLHSRAAAKGQHAGKIMNTSVSVLQLSEGDMWSIKSWNDISHLTQTDVLESAFGGDASSAGQSHASLIIPELVHSPNCYQPITVVVYFLCNVLQGKEPVDQSCTEIIIVRHGQTEWNVLGKMQGQIDIDLDEVGRQQAQAVAERLSRECDIAAVYSSDLKRALETAEIIAAKCCGLEVIKEQGLRERHLGDLQQLQGLLDDEASKLNPEAYAALRSTDPDQDIPGGGESRNQLQRRCTSSLKRIGERHRGQRVVVVSHGAAIDSLYKRAVPDAKRVYIENASIGVIQLSEGDFWLIKLWNDNSHLEETPGLNLCSSSAASMESHYSGVLQGKEPVDQSCTEIIIVRHGQTEWNALGKMQGQADIDLNELGRQQAQAVAERLSKECDIAAVYTSDLKRALETAEMIAAKCCGLEVFKDQDLRERHIGDLQGLAFHEASKLNPEAFEALKSHDSDQEIPGGGESRNQLQRRCTSSLKKISEIIEDSE